MAFLRIGRRIVVGSLMIVGVAGGGHCRSGAGDVGGVVGSSRRGVLQRRCGCCLVGLAGVGGGCVARPLASGRCRLGPAFGLTPLWIRHYKRFRMFYTDCWLG